MVDAQDLIVVVRGGVVLIAQRGGAQRVKAIVEALAAAGREDLL